MFSAEAVEQLQGIRYNRAIYLVLRTLDLDYPGSKILKIFRQLMPLKWTPKEVFTCTPPCPSPGDCHLFSLMATTGDALIFPDTGLVPSTQQEYLLRTTESPTWESVRPETQRIEIRPTVMSEGVKLKSWVWPCFLLCGNDGT